MSLPTLDPSCTGKGLFESTTSWRTRDDDCCGSIPNRVLQIVVPIEPLTTERDENIALRDFPGVRCYRGNLCWTARKSPDGLTRKRRSNPVERPESGAHAWLRVISFTISFSSNGYEVVPRI